MAIETGTHEVRERAFPLVVGSAVLSPVALNPDKAQLHELGLPVQEEPKYIFTSKKGQDWRIVSIYLGGTNNAVNAETGKLEPVEVLAELRFLLGTTAGPLYINQEGRFAGEGKKGGLGETARLEYQNEHKLIDFLKSLGRVGNGKKCYLADIDKLIHDGDMTELSEMLEQCVNAGFAVRVAVGVEKIYQRVNTEAFAMDNASSLTYFHDQLAKQADYTGDAYYGSFYSDSSTLQVQNATRLHLYHEEEALAHEDQKTQRANARLVPQGVGMAAAAPAPASDAEASAYVAPGTRFGTGVPTAPAAPGRAPEAPQEPAIPSDDDNDLPF